MPPLVAHISGRGRNLISKLPLHGEVISPHLGECHLQGPDLRGNPVRKRKQAVNVGFQEGGLVWTLCKIENARKRLRRVQRLYRKYRKVLCHVVTESRPERPEVISPA